MGFDFRIKTMEDLVQAVKDYKAVFISRKWFPDFANYRREGYDFDARYEDGLTSFRDKELYELVDANAPALSKKLKKLGGYRKGGKKGFDSIITRLQAQCYVVISVHRKSLMSGF